MIGTTLQDRYRIESTLGEGGMGVVYRARDTRLNRDVAVKMLGDGALDDDARARLSGEARAAAALNHPHIVAVYDSGETAGVPFVVMELVAGGSLRALGPVPLETSVAIARQLCQALEHAHAHGFVHRDLKPENILVSGEGAALSVKLADLGVAFSRATARLTQDGAIVGTASYLAPEQAMGGEVDGRADLYALGVLLYELTTGRLPFMGDEPLAVISQHLNAPVVPPRTYRADLSPELDALIVRLLAKLPADRYPAARDVAEALDALPAAGAATAAGEGEVTEPVRMLDQLARGRMIGRAVEVKQLQELWARAMRGQGHLALVSGEPGVGKTRLAREVMVYGQMSGAVLLQGGCYEFEATTPYLPFVEALRKWVKTQDADALRSRLGATAAELSRLAPEIEAKLGPLAASVTLSPQEDRLRLFDHVARLLQSLAQERGVLLFLDDLHWADHGTLALLHYVLRNLKGERLLVLGAYREVELDRAHPLSAVLVEWNRERLATRVPLGRLTLEDTNRLLATLFGQDEVAPEFARALQRETEGNPFFIEEVIKALIEQGQIYRAEGEWQRHEVQELAIPQSIKAAVGRRLDRLKPETIEVLHTAAALGKVFEFAELVAVTAGAEDRLLDALDEASIAQLVRAESGDAFVFTHDKIREVLHDELNPIRQRRLHQRVGESLEKLYADELDAHVQDLAYHFAESSDVRKGLTYSLAAADRAERLYAHDEALKFLESARECAEALEEQEALRDVHERIGRVHSARGQVPDAVASFERALPLARTAPQRAAVNGAIGELHARVGDPRGLAYLQSALTEFDKDTQVNERALALATLGRYHHYRTEHTQAIRHLEEALTLAEPLDDTHTLHWIYTYMAGSYQHLGRYEESLAWARKCIALGQRKGDPATEAGGWEFVGEDSFSLGRWDEAIAAADREVELVRRVGAQDRAAWAEFSRANAQFGRGEIAEALATASALFETTVRIGEGRLGIWALGLKSMAETTLGDLESARTHAEEAVARGEKLGQLVVRAAGSQALGLLFMALGEPATAADKLLEGLAPGKDSENIVHRMILGATTAEALVRAGRLDEAEALLRDFIPLAHGTGSPFWEGVLWRAKAQHELAAGQPAAALEAVHEAEMLERIDARVEWARALRVRGLAKRALGDAAGARADLARARELFERCGATPEAAQAEREMTEDRATVD